MTKIKLELDETDLYNAIRGIINHANADEIAKFLSCTIGNSPMASNIFFKTYLGDVSPNVLPVGTMIKVDASGLSWRVNVYKMKEKNIADEDGNCVAIIKEFRGFYDTSNYYISFTNVNDEGNPFEDTGFITYKDILEVIEEF
jgi:hypothetical protein